MNRPQVSVILSSYNDAAHLPEALDSILRQTFADFELIVIDDGSEDETPAILNNYSDPRLVVIRNEHNLGLTRSLNKALEHAGGELIARHDADDVSHPDRFRQQVSYLRAHPDVGLLGTGYYVIGEEGQVLDAVRLPGDDARLRERLEHGNTFCHGSVMFRRAVFEQAGRYRDQFPVTQDYDLWLRMAEHCQIATLSGLLYQFRIRATTISRQKRALQLAYARLARELAVQRATTGGEAALPDDVSAMYPPEPWRLVREARNTAYLYYGAGELVEAEKQLQTAKQLLSSVEDDTNWEEWSLRRAAQFAHLRNSTADGAAFIAWVLDSLAAPDSGRAKARALGRYYATQAFAAHQYGPQHDVPGLALEAVRHDPRWLRNRGLWSISAQHLRSHR